MTNNCELKRGFFVMRTCTATATTKCGNCQRSVCQNHLANFADLSTCVECASRQNNEYHDDYWIYSYRRNFYNDGYQPFRFTDEDYSSFETLDDGSEDWDDDYEGDFHDS